VLSLFYGLYAGSLYAGSSAPRRGSGREEPGIAGAAATAESAAQAAGGPQRRTRPSLGARGRWHRYITMARRNSAARRVFVKRRK